MSWKMLQRRPLPGMISKRQRPAFLVSRVSFLLFLFLFSLASLSYLYRINMSARRSVLVVEFIVHFLVFWHEIKSVVFHAHICSCPLPARARCHSLLPSLPSSILFSFSRSFLVFFTHYPDFCASLAHTLTLSYSSFTFYLSYIFYQYIPSFSLPPSLLHSLPPLPSSTASRARTP